MVVKLRGELVLDNGVLRYYDPNSGARVSNTTLTINGMTYRFDENGVGMDAPNPNGYYSDDNGNWYYKNVNGDNLTGAQIINGQKLFSATMVNRLKVLMVIPTVIYTHSTILILEIL